ncbi:MAG: PP2C family protein-serine/threonine phosphatase [Alphaproteobacteria bacterium]
MGGAVWRAFGASDVGSVRARNEDVFAIDDVLGCCLVADGLGGHPAGDVASAMARAAALEALRAAPEQLAADPRGALERAVRRANATVHRAAGKDPALRNMGTTLTLLRIEPAGGRGCIAHVGDSRAYRLDASGFRQLTEDHTLALEMLRAGLITPEEARRTPARHRLIRAVGLDDNVAVDVFPVEAAGAGAFLLCSDGLTGMVEDSAIAAILRDRAPDAEAACHALIAAALEGGGEDNVTVVVACPAGG